MRYLFLLISFFIAISTSAFAEDASVRGLQDKVDRLEKDLNTVQKQVYRGSSGRKDDGKPAEMQPAELDEMSRRFNGKIEETEFKINKISEKLDKISADIEYRLTDMESKLAKIEKQAADKAQAEQVKADEVKSADEASDTAVAAAEELAKTEEPAAKDKPVVADKTADKKEETPKEMAKAEEPKKEAVKKDDSPKAKKGAKDEKVEDEAFGGKGQYDAALELFRKSDYDKAEKAFKDFIAANKGSDLVSNAYYWLGESYYSRENYTQSAVNFLKGYQDNAKGNKASDNLLKLAMSLEKLKKTKEACTTLDKLTKEFPKADAATKEKVKKERVAAKCS
jgi:tol-pal system protein YbgF